MFLYILTSLIYTALLGPFIIKILQIKSYAYFYVGAILSLSVLTFFNIHYNVIYFEGPTVLIILNGLVANIVLIVNVLHFRKVFKGSIADVIKIFFNK